jgi:hypothetical protein
LDALGNSCNSEGLCDITGTQTVTGTNSVNLVYGRDLDQSTGNVNTGGQLSLTCENGEVNANGFKDVQIIDEYCPCNFQTTQRNIISTLGDACTDQGVCTIDGEVTINNIPGQLNVVNKCCAKNGAAYTPAAGSITLRCVGGKVEASVGGQTISDVLVIDDANVASGICQFQTTQSGVFNAIEQSANGVCDELGVCTLVNNGGPITVGADNFSPNTRLNILSRSLTPNTRDVNPETLTLECKDGVVSATVNGFTENDVGVIDCATTPCRVQTTNTEFSDVLTLCSGLGVCTVPAGGVTVTLVADADFIYGCDLSDEETVTATNTVSLTCENGAVVATYGGNRLFDVQIIDIA